MTSSPIIVGFDGSPAALAALDWALDEAARQAAPVRLAHVHEWAAVPALAAVGNGRRGRFQAEESVAAALDGARHRRPGLVIDAVVREGMVTSELRALSRHARLLVVGNRGQGGFGGMLAGSTAAGVAAHARCPVVVVRGVAVAGRPVVVGVDESAESDHALAFAFEQAAARGVELMAVRAWRPPPVPWRRDGRPLSGDAGEIEAAQRRLTADAVQPWQDKYAQVAVTVRLLPNPPAQALVTASYDAQLVVVGARGSGGFRGLLLGSVARQLIHHSSCPVAVVRDGV